MPSIEPMMRPLLCARRRDLPAWEAFEKLAPKMLEIAASHEREMTATRRAIITRMKSAKPAELDEMFVEEMLRLGEIAFQMIKQTQLRDPGVKQLAERVAETQRVELQQLTKLRQPTSAPGR